MSQEVQGALLDGLDYREAQLVAALSHRLNDVGATEMQKALIPDERSKVLLVRAAVLDLASTLTVSAKDGVATLDDLLAECVLWLTHAARTMMARAPRGAMRQ